MKRWKDSGEGREREVTEIRGGDHGRSLGFKLELEGGRGEHCGKPKSFMQRRRQNSEGVGREGRLKEER